MKPDRRITWIEVILLTAFVVAALMAASALAGDVDVLKTLKPLPKTAYWFEPGGNESWTAGDRDWLREVCRVCGSCCMRLDAPDPRVISMVMDMADALSVPIGLNLSPTFGNDETPCGTIGPETEDYFQTLLGDCASFAKKCDPKRVRRVLVDFEQWRLDQPDDPADRAIHNAALIYRVNRINQILRANFPSAAVDWYQAGQMEFLHGWALSQYGGDKIVPAVPNNCTLYQMDRFDWMINKLQQNLDAAGKRGVPLSVTVGLGWSFKTDWDHKGGWACLGQSPGWWCLNPNRIDYGPAPAWSCALMGAVLCDPWVRPPDWPGNANIQVLLYPGPCDPRCAGWGRNFIQFAAGATRGAIPDSYRLDPAGADLDGDGDVDQEDFGILQRCMSGANVPMDPACSHSPAGRR